MPQGLFLRRPSWPSIRCPGSPISRGLPFSPRTATGAGRSSCRTPLSRRSCCEGRPPAPPRIGCPQGVWRLRLCCRLSRKPAFGRPQVESHPWRRGAQDPSCRTCQKRPPRAGEKSSPQAPCRSCGLCLSWQGNRKEPPCSCQRRGTVPS